MGLDIVFKLKWTFLLLLAVASCKKPEDRRCWKASGETTTIRVEIDDFSYLNLKKKLHYTLIQDDSTYLVITGGKNLLKFVNWGMNEDGFMVVSNSNKCNFLRNEEKVLNVEVHFKTLSKLKYEGSESLNTPDTLKLTDFDFTVLDACGTLNILVNADYISGDVAHGWGDYNLRGIAKKARFSIRSNGYANVENLKISEEITLFADSPGDLYINGDQVDLKGNLSGSGNVYYTGTPKSISVDYFSTGKLIKR